MLQNALSSICAATQQISATQTELVRHLSGLPYYYPQPSWNYPHPSLSGLLTPSSNSTGSTTGTTKQAPDTIDVPHHGSVHCFDTVAKVMGFEHRNIVSVLNADVAQNGIFSFFFNSIIESI